MYREWGRLAKCPVCHVEPGYQCVKVNVASVESRRRQRGFTGPYCLNPHDGRSVQKVDSGFGTSVKALDVACELQDNGCGAEPGEKCRDGHWTNDVLIHNARYRRLTYVKLMWRVWN